MPRFICFWEPVSFSTPFHYAPTLKDNICRPQLYCSWTQPQKLGLYLETELSTTVLFKGDLQCSPLHCRTRMGNLHIPPITQSLFFLAFHSSETNHVANSLLRPRDDGSASHSNHQLIPQAIFPGASSDGLCIQLSLWYVRLEFLLLPWALCLVSGIGLLLLAKAL